MVFAVGQRSEPLCACGERLRNPDFCGPQAPQVQALLVMNQQTTGLDSGLHRVSQRGWGARRPAGHKGLQCRSQARLRRCQEGERLNSTIIVGTDETHMATGLGAADDCSRRTPPRCIRCGGVQALRRKVARQEAGQLDVQVGKSLVDAGRHGALNHGPVHRAPCALAIGSTKGAPIN